MNTLLQAVAANQRFLGKTNPTMTAAVADSGSILDREYIQRAARGIVDAGHWSNLKLWVDPGLAKLRNSGGVDYVPKLYDFSGNGNNPAQTDESLQPYLTSGFLDFNADYLITPDSNSLTFGNGTTDSAFSISFWIDMQQNKAKAIMAKASAAAVGEYYFNVGSNNVLTFRLVDNSASSYHTISTATNYFPAGWHFFVMTYSGNGATTGVKFYKDNSEDTSLTKSTTGTYTATENTNEPLYIGSRGTTTATTNFFEGKLNDIRVYNIELTSAQMTAIYNQTSYRYA